jgi:predicted DNA-binding protein
VPGVRKINPEGVGVADTRVAVLLPKDVGRQLRALAARRNSAVAPIIREWIIEKLNETGDSGVAK